MAELEWVDPETIERHPYGDPDDLEPGEDPTVACGVETELLFHGDGELRRSCFLCGRGVDEDSGLVTKDPIAAPFDERFGAFLSGVDYGDSLPLNQARPID